MRNNLQTYLLVLLTVGLCALPAFGQGSAGSLSGTVTDPKGAVVAGTTVTAKNTATNQGFSTQTNTYSIPTLSSGVFSREENEQIFAEIGGSQDLEVLEKYAQFSQFSKGDRKVRFNQISPQEKSDLWRVHLGLNLARHAAWTDQQRSIVLEAIGIASSSLYQTPKDKNWTRLADEPIRLFGQRALLVFSEQEAAALFAELGADEPKAHHAKLTLDGNCSCSSVSTLRNPLNLETRSAIQFLAAVKPR